MLNGFHHIAIQCKDIDKSIAFYTALGGTVYRTWGEGNSRRQRIAKGSGVQLQEINQLLKQFNQMRAVMAKMGNGGFGGLGGLFGGGGGMGGLGGLFGGGAPGGAPSMPANPYGGGMYGYGTLGFDPSLLEATIASLFERKGQAVVDANLKAFHSVI